MEDNNGGFVMSDEKGEFEYKLKDRKIVHNQEIEVSSSSLDGLEEDDEEEEIEKSSDNKGESIESPIEKMKKLKSQVMMLQLHTLHKDTKVRIRFLISN